MLVLSRKLGEKIRIGNDIEITLCQISGNRIRLGIDAPKETNILRGELQPRIEEQEDASDVQD